MVCEATNHYFDHVANMHVDQTNAVLKNALYKIGHDPDDSEYSFTRKHDPDVGRMAQKIICFLARKKCPRTLSLLALPPNTALDHRRIRESDDWSDDSSSSDDDFTG